MRIGIHTFGDELAFHRRVCVCQGRLRLQIVAAWDDVNCRTGVALPTGFPGQVSGRNFSEGKVM